MATTARRSIRPHGPDGLGERVRKCRMQLGMSLADVAQDDFSRAFLNQIELGRARPSTRTLEIIARRLRRPIDYFLDEPEHSLTAVELEIVSSETRLKQGDAAGARSQLSTLLERPYLSLEVRTKAQLLAGEAHLRLGMIPDGMRLLEQAQKAAETAKWWPILVEIYDRIGTAYYLLRRPHEAGRWFDKAFSTYEAHEVADPILKARVLGHRANLHYVAGQPRDAIAAYQAAITAAEHVLDMQGLGGIYEGLALSYQRTGDLSRALSYAQRSLRLFETLQDVRMSAKLRNNMAEILLEQGRAKEAEALFMEGAAELAHVRDQDLRPHLLAGAAEAALDQGDLHRAEQRLAETLPAANASRDPLARLNAHRVAGRVAQARGEWSECRSHFELALDIARSVDSPMERSRVAYDFAQALAAQGDSEQAIVHYREAYEARQSSRGA